jgi:hypothetical protein
MKQAHSVLGKACAIGALVLLANCGDKTNTPADSGGSGGGSSSAGSQSAGSPSSSGASGSASSAGSSSGGLSGVGGSVAGSSSGGVGAVDAGTDAGPSGPPQTVSGQIYGLMPGESLTLQNNGGDNLTLSANGKFTFPKSVAGGSAYNVTVLTAPATPVAQTCLVWDGTDTIGTAPVTNVRVNCDLIAYYPFNGDAKDESGYGHDAVVTGATLTADRNGNANSAYSFGNKAIITATMPLGFLPLNDQARTLTAWLKPSQSNSLYGVIFWGAGNCTGLQFGLADQGDKAAFWGGCDDHTSELPLTVGAWTFVALTYSPDAPTSLGLYVNDSFTTVTITPLLTGASVNFVMGGDTGTSSYFTGDMDSVRIYSRALQSAEVAALRTATDH